MTTSPVMGITEELLAELEEKAKAATPGPWRIYYDDVIENHEGEFVIDVLTWTDDDATHIAAANPATLLAMIAHIRSLEVRLEKVEKDAARYQWLREREAEHGLAVVNVCEWTAAATCIALTHNSAGSLDDAIDAAIAQEGADHE